MSVREFKKFLKESCGAFRLYILGYMINGSNKTAIKDFLKEALDKCTNDFEEQILTERLKEEFDECLEVLRVEKGQEKGA